MEKLPFYDCPRYQKCSVNNCPLSPAFPGLAVHEDDHDKKCTLAKSVRLRIASEFYGALKFEGMTSKEYHGKIRWESMTLEKQEEMRNRGKSALQLFKVQTGSREECTETTTCI